MIYTLIKAAHVAGVMTFIGGLLMLSIAISTSNLTVQRIVRRWDRRVTAPALLIVWISGLTIAVHGNWLGQDWLTVKLVLVGGLSALHGVLAGATRRMEREDAAPASAALQKAGIVTVCTVTAISLLVTLKDIRFFS